MTTNSRKRLAAVGGDRLTGLPINVIHQIQDHMSIEDAARTSVLSSSWRYVWASNPKLVFCTRFCIWRRITGTLIDTISTILSQHHGVIKEFLLDISTINSSQRSIVDEWILLLSRNGLANLALENTSKPTSAPYELPSYVYSAELERLYLSRCIFRPPCGFKGFHKLKRLSLKQVSFELDAAISSLWMPNLVILCFMHCTGLRHLKIYAPELEQLNFYGCSTDIFKLSSCIDWAKLETVVIAFKGEVSLNGQEKAMKLTNLWPNVRSLGLDRFFLKFFASGGTEAAARLPPTLNGLRVLHLYNYDFDSEDQISPLLCILRSSPNLKELLFILGRRKKGSYKVGVNYFEGPNCRAECFNNLLTLQINKFHGSITELQFVRFILSSATLLRKAILLVDESVHQSQSLNISKQLMRFPRASHKLEITYKPWSVPK